jgi:hypothetical protein
VIEIVTVTCDRDRDLFFLQAQSIDLYIEESCIHWVIVESSEWSVERWQQELAPYYTKHTLHVISMQIDKQVNYKISGRYRQQIFKFKIAPMIQGDSYLILDSKNFFIRPTKLDHWPIAEGNGCLTDEHHQNDMWLPWINDIKKVTGFPSPYNYWITQTPFVCKTSTVKKILNIMDFEGMFLDRKVPGKKNIGSPSEFILYGFLADDEPVHVKPRLRPHKTFWAHDGVPTPEQLQEFYDRDAIKVLGFHRNVMKTNEPALLTIADFLTTKGFDKEIAKKAMLSFVQNN